MHCGAGCPGVGLGCVCVSGCLVVCVGVRGGWVGEGHVGGVPRGGYPWGAVPKLDERELRGVLLPALRRRRCGWCPVTLTIVCVHKVLGCPSQRS